MVTNTRNCPHVRFMLSWMSILFCMLCAGTSYANSIPYHLYTISDGLPHENISTIAQTPDGRLWIGTSAGLSYFTGKSFVNVRFLEARGTVNITEVAPIKNDEVWVSTNHQGLWRVRHQHAIQPMPELAKIKAKRLIEFQDTLHIFDEQKLWKIALDDDSIYETRFVHTSYEDLSIISADITADGVSWILDEKYGPGKLQRDGSVEFLPSASSVIDNGWYALRFDRSGTGWATHESRGLYRFDPATGNMERVLSETGVRHICVTPEMIVVTSYNHGALYWNLKTDSPMPPLNEKAGLPTNRINCIFRDHEGNAWIGTQIGLIHLTHPGARHLIEIDGRPLVNMHTAALHKNGSLWASSHTEGLFQLYPQERAFQPQNETSWSDLFEGQDGRLHALGQSGWFVNDDSGEWKQEQSYAGGIRGVVDEDGVGYFWHQNGIFRHEAQSPATPLYVWPESEWKYSGHTLSSDNFLHVWLNGRLVRIPKSNRIAHQQDVELIKDIPAYKNIELNAMTVDYLGRTWVALLNNGILCVEPDTVIQLLPGFQVENLSVKGDSLLIANAHEGLFVFNLPKPAPEPDALHLQADSTIRYNLTQVDGLLSSVASNAVFDDKNLWITHPAGVTLMPRRLLQQEPPVPHVLLTSINYNGIERSAKKPIELEPGDRNIRFAFNATSFSSPHNIQYRYRLQGLNDRWAETDRSFVQYTGLPAGKYTFEVQASAAKRQQYGNPVAYSFQIPQPYYQHPAFWITILLLLTLLMYVMHRYRIRTIVQVERTRTQIAMDLHDDIGSSLTSLSFMSSLAWQRTEQQTPKEEITPLLQEIGSMSSELVDNMLDIVWSVDPKQDSVGSIVSRLQAFYQRMEEASDVSIEWHLGKNIQDLPLPPRSRRNLYLILKESINNAIKHSGAAKIDLHIEQQLNSLLIVVSDNGHGFDADTVKTGYGLKTMCERAEESGATLQMESEKDVATKITLKWPLKYAA